MLGYRQYTYGLVAGALELERRQESKKFLSNYVQPPTRWLYRISVLSTYLMRCTAALCALITTLVRVLQKLYEHPANEVTTRTVL